MASEIKFENIDYECIEEVLNFPIDQESSCEFEMPQNYIQLPITNELPQVFFITCGENLDGNFTTFVKEDELIIEDEVLDIINQMNHNQYYNEGKFYESSLDSSFEKVMQEVYQQKGKEEKKIAHEVNYEKLLIDAIHEEPPKIICGICQKKFVKRSYLLQHINYKHTEKPFRCVKCHKKFANEDALENHMMKHQNIYKPFKCEMDGCTKAYAYKSDLKIHHKNHVKELKSNVCECGKRFSRRDHLAKHKKTHVKKLMKQKNLMKMCGL